MAPKTNQNIWIVIALIVVILFLINRPLSVNLNIPASQTIVNMLDNPPSQTPGETCSISFDKQTIAQGDMVAGTLTDGINQECTIYFKFDPTPESILDSIPWTVDSIVNTGPDGVYRESRAPDFVGRYTLAAICGDCVTPSKTITVNKATSSNCVDSDGEDAMTFGHVELADEAVGIPDTCHDADTVIEQICVGDLAASKLINCPSGFDCSGGRCIDGGLGVGDFVGSGSGGSGSAGFGDDILTDDINVDGWTTGGPFLLGARITRSWDYVSQEGCFGPEQFPMEYTFWDSNGLAWQALDYTPVNNVVAEVCPVTYHSDVPWRFDVSVGIQACEVSYNWQIQPYICGEV